MNTNDNVSALDLYTFGSFEITYYMTVRALMCPNIRATKVSQ